MMGQLLAELMLVLKAYLVDDVKAVSTVQVIYEVVGQNRLEMHHLPAIIVFPERYEHPQGPFTITAKGRYTIKVMGITQSTDPAAYQILPTAGETPTVRTIHDIADLTQTRLYQQKKLTGTSTFEMEPVYDISYGMWQGLYPMFSLNLVYTKLETYSGMQNDQASLDLPPPQIPGMISF
jgi:hypothetical protein